MQSVTTAFRLIPDHSIGEGRLASMDALGFAAYARVLSEAVLATDGPFTIGVFGEWGSGKTSLMRLIADQLRDQPTIVTVWFNAWRYEREVHPLIPLVGALVHELERHQSLGARSKAARRTMIEALRSIVYGFSLEGKIKVPWLAELGATFLGKEMIARQEALAGKRWLDRSFYHKAFESLEAASKDATSRIVVFVDDLDRCFPDAAIRLLEGIKLVLSQHGFVFVLGVDRNVIEGYLHHRYRHQYGINDFRPTLYLDKLVQLPFQIPPHAGRTDLLAGFLLEDVAPDIRPELGRVLPTAASALDCNPRAVIRFVNALILDRAINAELVRARTMDAIPIEYFAISRCLLHRWPAVFAALQASDDLCSTLAQSDEAKLVELSKGSDIPAADVAMALRANPGLHALLRSGPGQAWLKEQTVRHAALTFLQVERQVTAGHRAEDIERPFVWVVSDAQESSATKRIVRLLDHFGFSVSENLTPLPVPVKPEYYMDGLPSQRLWQRETYARLNASRCIVICISVTPVNLWLAKLARSAEFDGLIGLVIFLPGSGELSEVGPFSSLKIVDCRDEVVTGDALAACRELWTSAVGQRPRF